MFAVLAAAAEYEPELRAERQAEGTAAAQRREGEGRMLPGKKRRCRPCPLYGDGRLRVIAVIRAS